MIKTTRWKPDTCGCEIEYSWDDSVSEDKRAHTVSKVNKTCPDHANLADNPTKYAKVLEENQTKNKVYAQILENCPDLVEEKTNPDGTVSKQLKPDKEYKWSFDGSRKLQVEVVGASLTDKTTITNIVNNIFPGKVKII